MKEWLPKIIDRICAVVGALLFMQFPLFAQQYSQRLSGHLEELRYQVGLMNGIAVQSGKTLQEFILKFAHNSDIDVGRQGELMEMMVTRLGNLNQALYSLNHSTVFTKPFTFIYYSDWEIFKSTMASYKLGIPISIEGLVYGMIGIFVGYFTFSALSALFTRVKRFVQVQPQRK